MSQSPYANQPQPGYQAPPAQPYGAPPTQGQAGQGYTPYQRPPKEGWAKRSNLAGILLIVSALVAVVAAFLPWGSVSFDDPTFNFGDVGSFNGFEGTDGWLASGTAVVLIVLGILSFVRASRVGITGIAITVSILAILCGLWLAFIGIANMSGPDSGVGSLDSFGIDFTPGVGLYLMILAGLIAIGGGAAMIASQVAAPKGADAKRPNWQPNYGNQQGPYQPPQPPPPAGYAAPQQGYPPAQDGHSPPAQPGQQPPPGAAPPA